MEYNSLIPELSISNLEKSLDFYIGLLGFKISYKREEEGFAFIYLGTSQIMLDEIDRGRTWKTGDLEYPLGRGINFQILVDDVMRIYNDVKAKKYDIFMDIEEKFYDVGGEKFGNRQFCLKDPDGYLLRFFEEI